MLDIILTRSQGTTTFSITPDTTRSVRDVHHPEFLKGVVFNVYNQDEWYGRVLPHIAKLELVVNSTVDVYFIVGT